MQIELGDSAARPGSLFAPVYQQNAFDSCIIFAAMKFEWQRCASSEPLSFRLCLMPLQQVRLHVGRVFARAFTWIRKISLIERPRKVARKKWGANVSQSFVWNCRSTSAFVAENAACDVSRWKVLSNCYVMSPFQCQPQRAVGMHSPVFSTQAVSQPVPWLDRVPNSHTHTHAHTCLLICLGNLQIKQLVVCSRKF